MSDKGDNGNKSKYDVIRKVSHKGGCERLHKVVCV